VLCNLMKGDSNERKNTLQSEKYDEDVNRRKILRTILKGKCDDSEINENMYKLLNLFGTNIGMDSKLYNQQTSPNLLLTPRTLLLENPSLKKHSRPSKEIQPGSPLLKNRFKKRNSMCEPSFKLNKNRNDFLRRHSFRTKTFLMPHLKKASLRTKGEGSSPHEKAEPLSARSTSPKRNRKQSFISPQHLLNSKTLSSTRLRRPSILVRPHTDLSETSLIKDNIEYEQFFLKSSASPFLDSDPWPEDDLQSGNDSNERERERKREKEREKEYAVGRNLKILHERRTNYEKVNQVNGVNHKQMQMYNQISSLLVAFPTLLDHRVVIKLLKIPLPFIGLLPSELIAKSDVNILSIFNIIEFS